MSLEGFTGANLHRGLAGEPRDRSKAHPGPRPLIPDSHKTYYGIFYSGP